MNGFIEDHAQFYILSALKESVQDDGEEQQEGNIRGKAVDWKETIEKEIND